MATKFPSSSAADRGPLAGPNVVCVGVTPALQRTLRFDRLRPGDVNRVRSVDWSGGGKATNVCRVLGQLGERALLTGFRGGDAGRRLDRILAQEGVTAHLVEVEAETRICQTLIDEFAGEATELVEEAVTPPPVAWKQLGEGLRVWCVDAKIIVFSGKLPPGAASDAYRRLIDESGRGPLRVYLDTQGAPLREAVGPSVELVKINAAECAATFGEAAKGSDVWPVGMERMREAGVAWVLITQGPGPAWLAGPEGKHWRFDPPTVAAVNPIGSGDAALAGIAHARLRGATMPDAVRFGLACGSANARTSTAGRIRPDDVERLCAAVTLREESRSPGDRR